MLPALRLAPAPGRSRMAVRRVRFQPARGQVGAGWGVGHRLRRPGPRAVARAARPGQPRQRRCRARRGRVLRCRAGPGAAPAAQGEFGGRPVHPAGAARPGAAAAAGQEPGWLAGGVRRADPGSGTGAAGRQRAGARRQGHVLAVGRGLPGAARPPGADLRRAQARPRGEAGGGRGEVRAGRWCGRRGGPGASRQPGRDRQLHGVPADPVGSGPRPMRSARQEHYP